MADLPLEVAYRRYLACLNARRLDQLGEFVRDQVTYNGRTMSREAYGEMIRADLAAAPDLMFNIATLVTSAEIVACRLAFECTPIATFLGLRPSGRRVAFAEHVFYRFLDGRIAEVWSLIDRPAVAAQLASS